MDRAETLAGPPGHALEIGAEGGRWSLQLAARGWSLTCTDVDPGTLAVCQERLPNANCIVVDPSETRLPATDDSVRLLIAIEVAPVAESEWLAPEAARVLEPGGVLVATVYNPTSWRAAAYRLLVRTKRRRYEWYHGPSYREFRDRLERAGLSVVDERGYGWPPFTRDSDSRLIPVAVRLERMVGLRRLPSLSPFVIIVATKP